MHRQGEFGVGNNFEINNLKSAEISRKIDESSVVTITSHNRTTVDIERVLDATEGKVFYKVYFVNIESCGVAKSPDILKQFKSRFPNAYILSVENEFNFATTGRTAEYNRIGN